MSSSNQSSPGVNRSRSRDNDVVPSSSSGGSKLEVDSGGGGVAAAQQQQPAGTTTTAAAAAAAAQFKLLLLICMVLQNSSTVLVGRYTRTSTANKEDLYEVNHLIMVTEASKFILACFLEWYSTAGMNLTEFIALLQHFISKRPTDALKMTVPALLYLVQNTLLYVALSNLTAPIFQVTYQGKLVTTAIVSVIMLQRNYTVQQWICLVVLSVGVAIVVLGEKKDDKKDEDKANVATAQNLVVGLTAVSIACMSSALAGVYFEKVLKKKGNEQQKDGAAPAQQASLWMRNIQLAFFSMLIALGRGWYESSKSGRVASNDKPYLHGFTAWVWVLVALQAGGGMLVAAVIKYADNVLKGLATGVSVVLATACSMVLFGTPLTGQFCGGAVMILCSVYWFSNPLPAACRNVAAKAAASAAAQQQPKMDKKETAAMLPK